MEGKLVVYNQAHLSTDQASPGSPPEAPSTESTLEQPKSYMEIAGKQLLTSPASTGLEDSLAKLTTCSSETSKGQEVSGNCKETRGQLATDTPRVIPGLVQEPPKEMPAEKKKRKRKAAKAA